MTLGDIKNLIKQKVREVSVGTGTFDIKDTDLNNLVNSITRELVNILPIPFLDPLIVYVTNQSVSITTLIFNYDANNNPTFMTVSLPSDFFKTDSRVLINYQDSQQNINNNYICYKTLRSLLSSLEKEFIMNINYFAIDNTNFIFDRKITDEIHNLWENSSGADEMYISYYYVKKPTTMTSDTDTFPLDDRFVPIVVAGASKDLFMRYELYENANLALNEYQSLLSVYMKGDQNDIG